MKRAGSSSLGTFRVIQLALALSGAVLCQNVLAQGKPAPEKDAHPKPVVMDQKAKAFGPQANPDEIFRETHGKSAMKAHGLEVKTLHGRDAGKPISSMRGAKAVSRAQLQAMKEIPKTGLYLVDLDHVPPGLEEDFRRNGYELKQDGTLTQNGKPVSLFVHGETFHFTPVKSTSWLGRTADQIVEAATSVISTSEARAASPFPWACGSWYWKWQYDGGFCRDYKAWTDAYAWGAGPGGGCSDPKPMTNIQYISTYASIGSHTGYNYHYNADQSHSYAEWDIGCFWPAHGTGSGYHYAYWQDGSAWLYRTYSW